MKYGAHCFLFTDRWSDRGLDLLDTVRELGVEVFDLAVGDDVHFTPRLTRQRAEALGLELLVSPGGHWPLECDLSADDPADRARGLAWHKKQVDLGAEVGATAYSGALYGHPGVVERRRPSEAEYQHAADGLHQLAEHGEKLDVLIVPEPMSRFRTHLVNTPAQLIHLLEMADHSHLRVLLDTYHLMPEVRDYAEAIRTVGDKLWGLHACENDRGVPGGGLVPWETVFAGLKEISFDGYLLLETYNSSIGDFAYERGVFQDVCPDGHAFVRQGLAFLRQFEGT